MNPPFKYSGVHWIGKVPSNWNILALKRYAPYISRGRSPDYTDDKYKGIPIINQACIYWDGLKLEKVKFQDPNVVTGYGGKVYQGDLLINSTGTGTLGRVGVFNLDGEYLADSHVTIIRPAKEIFAKYLYYLLQTDVYQGYIYSVLATGATNQIELSREGLSDTPIIVPPISQQKSIASFLDRKTATIDTLIAKKQRLIQLLEEKRTALIDRAVTKGLNPNAPMKDSGIPWIGEIPEHWIEVPIKRVCLSVRDGTHNPPPRVEIGEYRLLSARNIQNGEFILRDDDRLMAADAFVDLERSYTIRQGDVVIAAVGATTGKSAVVGDVEKVSVQRSIAILKPRIDAIYSHYLNFLISSSSLQHEIALIYSKYAAQGGIYLDDLANLACVLPSSLKEQSEILLFLDKSFTPILKIKKRLYSQIEKLQEYRRSLITAAVTGKLEIQEVP
jgi:type I restriction enzyme, S subunit